MCDLKPSQQSMERGREKEGRRTTQSACTGAGKGKRAWEKGKGGRAKGVGAWGKGRECVWGQGAEGWGGEGNGRKGKGRV